MSDHQNKKIGEVLTRGVEQVFPSREELEKVLRSGKKIKLYCGFDPSANSLHIGNAIQLNKLSQFQELGHKVIFLVGDFTGMIGDPTDKTSVRKKMTREEVLKNSQDFQKQAESYLNFSGENPAQVLYNSEWSDKLNFKDLIEIASNLTVGQMIQRDMFQERMKNEKPIYLHEFLYPLAQGYDSVAMDVDLEIGGNDQMFNMLTGRTLMKVMKNKEKFVMTLKILADDAGKKMGKSEGNAVFLNQAPEKIFQNIMSWPDGLTESAFELCTKVPEGKIKEIMKKNPRESKMELGVAIVEIIYNKEKAQKARERYEKVAREEIPDDVRELEVKNRSKLLEVLVEAGLASSNSDARRKIEQGGVSISGEKINDWQRIITKKDSEKILRIGKSDFRKIKV